ncbi:hypothetical protein B0A52_10249 [Exophiala mesophila]|uniref:DUF7962 domain-containing protein n=1 Tax=Exophiala mesophila TaxID=212818 RepID=A0A438MQI6_EXOME|nr:hypothetical protein B0A52_10249 [Exophiala mesophila]
MMPRPILKDNFNVTYRKIPVLAIGKDIYIDTSLIIEVLEHQFPTSRGFGTVYPNPGFRPLIRGFASFWVDRPFFRVTTGVIPVEVWRTTFGQDRANLIGHKLDAEKLGRKVPLNLSGLDDQLSILEPQLTGHKWLFHTATPSAADVALFYQLDWAEKISRGEGVGDLTGGGTVDGSGEGIAVVFNAERYPNLSEWFRRFSQYLGNLPSTETRIERNDENGIRQILAELKLTSLSEEVTILPTPAPPHTALDTRNGMKPGSLVSIAPDDTGRGNPTTGNLLAITPEEIVISPSGIGSQRPAVGEVRVHFPKVGFVVRPLSQAQL